ncbi:MAG: hypothetical protein QOI77_3527 [Blastocatellia bacterium]|jgi:hypothetical protein|nr:hypothetical protein [Blastocatellia bacterium]
MQKRILTILGLTMAVVVFAGLAVRYGSLSAQANATDTNLAPEDSYLEPVAAQAGFTVDVLIDGRPLTEYAARGRHYVEAFENAEYEVRVHNPTGSRVAVALAVDGLNSIDARHTTAWDAHKWVIGPYGTIHVRGWQMSGESARRFYFTTERDSYAARLGQASNVGLITAVFFRERQPVTIMPVTPSERRPPYKEEDRVRNEQSAPEPKDPAKSSARNEGGGDLAKARSAPAYPPPDEESAATGIGRSVRNDVQWIKMDLDMRPAGEITIRYEYRAALVRLGIIPRDYPRPDVLDRRERAQGFEPKYCPQP